MNTVLSKVPAGITSIALVALAACDRPPDAPVTTGLAEADTLYVNGVIWTGVGDAPDASVMAVSDGAISYVGSGENVRVAARELVDLEGRFVMPGFIDNHVHFLEGGAGLASVDLRDASTPEEFTRRIVEHAAGLPAGRWVLNGYWDHELWGGELPHRGWIDAGTGDTPVMVYRLDGHMVLANSAALRLAGIDADSEAPAGGEIVRDEDGEPTGVLRDNAINAVLEVIPKPSQDELLTSFELAQSHALSLGITEVHAMTVGPYDGELDVFRLAAQRGLMKLRVYAFMPLERWEKAGDLVASDGTGDDLLRWGGLKGFVDGALGSSTAWFYDPFTDQPGNSGFPLTEPSELETLVADADDAELHLAIHAIGDRAIDLLIDTFRQTAGPDIAERRYRIEHFQHPTRDAVSALANSGIIASMQPYHAIDDGRWAEKRIGPERIKTTYAFRSILDAGGILTFGSDWPVAPLSPLEGVYAAVTRRTIDGANPEGWQPQEKITVEEALTAYTVTNAYAGFVDDTAGTLEAGKRADFVVLSDDPRRVDPAAIRDIRVLSTTIGGETVHSAGD